MTLEPGQQLLHYRLIEKIGEGGMGVVWKAVDTTLDREAAIKVLPDTFAADSDRLARFEREAKLLASLNHPNIAGIFGLHLHDGMHFLAMELVEGHDLAERLQRGRMPLAEALGVGRQVADALTAAHQNGVVHRDLKPANVRVTPDGTVKVLDLGLAKALAPDPISGGSVSLSPTITTAGTMAGAILGTAAYMSPEQARGAAVDQRADVWAFGCVMFEMLSGAQLHAGRTVSDSIASILKEEPPWDQLPASTPWLLRRLIERCLAKDPAKRLHSMADVRIELEDAEEGPPAGTEAAGVGDGAAAAARTPRWAFVAIGALALALAASWAWFGMGSDGSASGAASLPRMTVAQQTIRTGQEGFPSLSPDGTFLAYAASPEGEGAVDIFLERVGGRNPINLTRTPDVAEVTPAFSPDGSQIAFGTPGQPGGIFLMGATGESRRRLTDSGFEPAWSPDGKQIVYSVAHGYDPLSRGADSPLFVVDVESGETRRLEEVIDGVQPSWSPGGHRIAFWGVEGIRQASGQRDIFTVAADGTDVVSVTEDAAVDWNPVWSRDGRHLYFVSDRGGSMNVWRVPIDERTGRTRGEPEPVTVPAAACGRLALAGDLMAYTSRENRTSIHRVPLDPETHEPNGPTELLTRGSNHFVHLRLSPAGDRIVFRTASSREDLYVMNGDGSDLRKLTDDPHRDRAPSWLPDGESIVFYSNRTGRYQLWTMRIDGGGAQQLTELQDRSLWFPAVSPDGKRLAAHNSAGSVLFDLDREPPFAEEDGLELPLHEDGVVRRSNPRWSPDGRYLSFWSNESGTITFYDFERESYVQIETPESAAAVGVVSWLEDGRAVVRSSAAIYLLDVGARSFTQIVKQWEQPDGLAEGTITADGRWLYYAVTEREADIWTARLD